MALLELPGGGKRTTSPPRYATVPGLRKGNASRCNIKRASPHGCPPQPLRGVRVEGGGGAPPPRTPLLSNKRLPFPRLLTLPLFIHTIKIVHYKLRQLRRKQIHQYKKSAMCSHLCQGGGRPSGHEPRGKSPKPVE